MQLCQSLTRNLQLKAQKVGQVVVIMFTVQECAIVAHGRGMDDPGDRKEFKQPVATLEDVPVKQRPGGTPVSVGIRVLVSEPEVNNGSANQRMYERLGRRRLVCKGYESAKPLLQARSGWRCEHNFIVPAVDNKNVIGFSKLACLRCIVQSI